MDFCRHVKSSDFLLLFIVSGVLYFLIDLTIVGSMRYTGGYFNVPGKYASSVSSNVTLFSLRCKRTKSTGKWYRFQGCWGLQKDERYSQLCLVDQMVLSYILGHFAPVSVKARQRQKYVGQFYLHVRFRRVCEVVLELHHVIIE